MMRLDNYLEMKKEFMTAMAPLWDFMNKNCNPDEVIIVTHGNVRVVRDQMMVNYWEKVLKDGQTGDEETDTSEY